MVESIINSMKTLIINSMKNLIAICIVFVAMNLWLFLLAKLVSHYME